MSKKLILALTVLSFAFLGTTFAAVDSIKVSGSINEEAVTRDFALGGEALQDDADKFLFSQITLRFDADLTEGVSAVIELINERIWDQDVLGLSQGNYQFEINQAYVTLQEFLYQPLTLTIGRQNLAYGNRMIIGDSATASGSVPGIITDLTLTVAFDAVRAVLDYAPYTVDVVYAKVDENFVALADDVTLFGTNVSYDWSSYNGVTEGYFWSTDKAPGTLPGVTDRKSKVYTIGGRAQWDANDKWTFGIESAYQFGDLRNSATSHQHLSAYSNQFITQYRFLNRYNAKVGFNFTYLSGDDGKTASGSNAWNAMFEDQLQNAGEIIHALYTNTNAQIYTLTGSYMPREDITLGMLFTYLRLNEDAAAFTGINNGFAYAVDAGNTDLGQEIDIYAIYDYTEDVQLKLSSAFYMPGNFFDQANDETAYSVRGGIRVTF
ncbi:MAG: alginate export family protein [Omnitrophica bacterium]|nr:alginate export family protein [Candidatus Omnitrophota bacterium]